MAERIRIMTGAEFKVKAQETIETCKKYGFMENKIMPYGFRMTVAEFTQNWNDFDRCTSDSQSIMKDELKGFLPILDHWVAYANEPMITVRLIEGKQAGEVKEYHESTAKIFIDAGMATAI